MNSAKAAADYGQIPLFVDGREGALFLDDEEAITRYQAALAEMSG